MRILDLALKDWQQTVREKQAAIFLVIMPIVFTTIISPKQIALGATTTTSGTPEEDDR